MNLRLHSGTDSGRVIVSREGVGNAAMHGPYGPAYPRNANQEPAIPAQTIDVPQATSIIPSLFSRPQSVTVPAVVTQSIQSSRILGGVMKLVDMTDSKSVGVKPVAVRVRPPLPTLSSIKPIPFFWSFTRCVVPSDCGICVFPAWLKTVMPIWTCRGRTGYQLP
jgi:hypothetical protein